MENTPHVIAVPYPAQGHVIPMLELSKKLVKQGIKVTLFNTNFNHKRVVSSWSPSASEEAVTMVSFPDGLEPGEDRNELGRLTDAVSRVLPRELEALINGNGEFDCVLADWCMPWALEVAEKLGLRRGVFCPAATATMALSFSIPKLVSDGIIDQNDQFLNQSYIAEYWRVGLRLDKDESGIVESGEIVKKVELLLSDKSYKSRVMDLRSKTMSSITEGGSSYKNFNSFVDWIHENQSS